MLTSVLVSLCSCTCFNQCAHFSIKLLKKNNNKAPLKTFAQYCMHILLYRKERRKSVTLLWFEYVQTQEGLLVFSW